MAMADERMRHSTHLEEWFSIGLALLGTTAASIFIGYWPMYSPEHPQTWVIPVWCGFLYLIFQITFLLFSASQVRALGVLDSAMAIVPVVAGLVILVTSLINKTFELSTYQLNTLAVLIIAGASEFMLTIWIRFVINRRTIGFGGDN
jgi:hypothetical protein